MALDTDTIRLLLECGIALVAVTTTVVAGKFSTKATKTIVLDHEKRIAKEEETNHAQDIQLTRIETILDLKLKSHKNGKNSS